jgi:hypothetical protein
MNIHPTGSFSIGYDRVQALLRQFVSHSMHSGAYSLAPFCPSYGASILDA